MDVSDIVEYNAALLNHNNLSNSFFCLSKGDPISGFAFDASKIAGYAFPDASIDSLGKPTCGCRIRCGVVPEPNVVFRRETRLTGVLRDVRA